jgi:hypothetical protein
MSLGARRPAGEAYGQIVVDCLETLHPRSKRQLGLNAAPGRRILPGFPRF